jgi:YesN/AraC family two-component response regulator
MPQNYNPGKILVIQIWAFVLEVRINEACKKMLSNDYDSIYSIAYVTGFNNAITFNRVFKKITGKCPTEYILQFKSTVK